MSEYKNRIVGSGTLKVDEALFNPMNWRIHPREQQEALDDLLTEVGWIQQVIVNKTTGNIVDGHLRVQLADRNGEKTVPCVFVELTEAEEVKALLALDPIGAMAVSDNEKLKELVDSLGEGMNETMSQLVESLHGELDLPDPDPPEEFPLFDTDLEGKYRCPKCHYEWKGEPRP